MSLHCHDLEEVLAGVCRLGMAEGGVLSPEKGCPQSSSARWKEKERKERGLKESRTEEKQRLENRISEHLAHKSKSPRYNRLCKRPPWAWALGLFFKTLSILPFIPLVSLLNISQIHSLTLIPIITAKRPTISCIHSGTSIYSPRRKKGQSFSRIAA